MLKPKLYSSISRRHVCRIWVVLYPTGAKEHVRLEAESFAEAWQYLYTASEAILKNIEGK